MSFSFFIWKNELTQCKFRDSITGVFNKSSQFKFIKNIWYLIDWNNLNCWYRHKYSEKLRHLKAYIWKQQLGVNVLKEGVFRLKCVLFPVVYITVGTTHSHTCITSYSHIFVIQARSIRGTGGEWRLDEFALPHTQKRCYVVMKSFKNW